MKIFYLILFSFFILTYSYAQNIDSTIANEDNLLKNKSNNSIYAELLGTAFFYSLNYEKVLLNTNKTIYYGRIGLGQENLFYKKKVDVLNFPLMTGLYYGKKRSKLELSIGVLTRIDVSPYPKTKQERKQFIESGEYLMASVYSSPFEIFPAFVLGYCFRPIYKGVTIKISSTSLIDNIKKPIYFTISSKSPILLWGGISIGYIF